MAPQEVKTNVGHTPQVNGKESVTNPLGSGATTVSLRRKDPLFIRQMFDEFDTDKDGKVAPKELQAALSRLHIPTSEKQMEEIWWICDQNGDGAIEYPEFANFVLAKERELKQIFDSIGLLLMNPNLSVDTNGDGKIDAGEVSRGFASVYGVSEGSPSIDSKSLQAMMAVIDADHDGSVTFDEFQQFLALIPPPSSSLPSSSGSAAPPVNPYALFVFNYWKKAALVDIGENLSVPINTSKGQWWHYILAGGVAGGVSRTATAPLDRIKTVLQLQVKQAKGSGGVKSVLSNIWKEGGVRAFFRGNGTNCIKIIPESSFKFFIYEKAKSTLVNRKNTSSTSPTSDITDIERFFAGATAGALSQMLIYPLECIKTRLAAPGSPYRGISEVFQASARSPEGILSLYRGLTPSLIGIVPYAGIDLAVYEYLRGHYARLLEQREKKHGKTASLEVIAPLICGTISSSVAQLVSYPLGLVRTRLQAQGIQTKGGYGHGHGTPVVYTGMIDVFKKTIEKEGVRGLYRGIIPNYLKVIPAVSISYTVYEAMKKTLGL